MRCNPGEGAQVYQLASAFADKKRPLTPPLPRRAGEAIDRRVSHQPKLSRARNRKVYAGGE